MNLIKYCPNPDCRTRLQIPEPIPPRVVCPRCHGTVDLNRGGKQPSSLLEEFAEPPVSITDRRSLFNPPIWIWLFALVAFFVSTISAALMIINYRHISRLDASRSWAGKSSPFNLNFRFRPEERSFLSRSVESKGGWIQKWTRESDGVALYLGAMDFGRVDLEKEEAEGFVSGKLDALFPPSSYQIVTRKKDGASAIGGERVVGAWSVQVASSGEVGKDQQGGAPVEAQTRFGEISLVSRRGYLYWFLVLGGDPGVEIGSWWAGVEFGNDREGWVPQAAQEIEVPALGGKLPLDPATWRVLNDKERTEYFQILQNNPGASDKGKGQPDFKAMVQGRKKKSASLDGGLKTNAVLFAVKIPAKTADLDAFRAWWEKWRATQSPEGAEPPEIKLMPIAGQDGFFRSVINGESEDYLAIFPVPSENAAWFVTCLYQDREEWAGEFSRIKRKLAGSAKP